MAKVITIKLKRAGNRVNIFSISDNLGNILSTDTSKEDLIKGVSFEVEDSVSVIIVTQMGKKCCNKTINLPITQLTKQEVVDISFSTLNISSLWRHNNNTTLYNNFYGCIHPYIIEYPFYSNYNDEIVKNIKDYTKVYSYLSNGDVNTRIQVDDIYFNKAIVYNDQQNSGILELVAKPIGNMKSLMSYPKLKEESKEIIYTKSDNFYQFNTFWNIVKNSKSPIFTTSCESLSIDKEVENSNLDYSNRSFRKDTIRGKDNKVRFILDNRSDVHLISQVITENTQISYK